MAMRRARKYQVVTGLVLLALGMAAAVGAVLAGAMEWPAALVVLGALTLVHLLLLVVLIRQWNKPLARLAQQMDEVRQGEHIAPVALKRDDEIGDLSRHFKAIVEGIRRARNDSEDIGRKQASLEKFAALGRLSAGVAHEINNPVGGILTCLESMRSLPPGSERFDEYLTLVTSGLERIGTIVRQLLSFSRKPGGERQHLDTNEVIREVTVLSSFQNRSGEVEVVHDGGLIPAVHGYQDLLNQLFLNLVLNALQAMPGGGTLHIRTWAQGGEVVTALEDTGPGIPIEHQERIFEPFFTTKEVGVGTGLGLSVALGIVEAHGGRIDVENREEGGARFTVRLPAVGADGASGNRNEAQR